MSIAQALLPEFDQEMSNTRRCLERIPTDKLDWKAHEKSWDLRSMATHLCNLPRWIAMTLSEPSFDLQPAGQDATREEPHPSHAHLDRALGWIERLKPDKAYLTHMNHTMDYDRLMARLPPGVEPAYDGLVIEV